MHRACKTYGSSRMDVTAHTRIQLKEDGTCLTVCVEVQTLFLLVYAVVFTRRYLAALQYKDFCRPGHANAALEQLSHLGHGKAFGRVKCHSCSVFAFALAVLQIDTRIYEILHRQRVWKVLWL